MAEQASPSNANDPTTKVNLLIRLMKASIKEAGNILLKDSESEFQDPSLLVIHNWTEEDDDDPAYRNVVLSSSGDAEKELGLRTEFSKHGMGSGSKEDLKLVHLAHKPTEGLYCTFFELSAGFVGPMTSESPRSKVDEDDAARLPPLVYWSDVTFLAMMRIDPKCRPPTHVLRMAVMNMASTIVIAQACKSQKKVPLVDNQLPEWPGILFNMDEGEEAKLLLATPNGKGVAWLLIAHKQRFGVLWTSAVRIFRGPQGLKFMLFYIDEV